MHLHSLRFGAVGPFPGEHSVEFADLAASGLFLLEGPTGSGKSTLIDMIVFALYGKVASREATEERLRSAHAAPGTETYVDLVLETGSGIYRVRRTPQYQRPKQRGTGTTTQQATVKLWRLTSPDAVDHGELVSTRLDEAGAELQRAVGLDRDQLVQTIVLPQGEFAGFLRAKPEDRRGLLQKVFGTGVYEQLQTRLERMRVEAQRQVEDAEQRIRQAAEGFAAAARLDDEAAAVVRELAGTSPVDGAALLAAVDAHTERLTLLGETAAQEAADAKERCAVRLAELDDARALQARVERRAALRAEQAALEARAEEAAERVRRLDAARRAEAVREVLDAVDRAEAAVRGAEAHLRDVVAAAPATLRDAVGADDRALDGAEGVADVAEPGVSAGSRDALEQRLSTEKDACTGQVAVLETLAEVERALPARREELAGLEASVADLEVRVAEQRDERAGRAAAREAIEAELAEARAVAAGLGAAQAAVTEAEARLEAATDVEHVTAELAEARAELARRTETARRAVADEAALRARRIAGIAGELAEGLVAGEPCVVCGSAEHPRPAARGADHVDDDAVATAEATRAAAERAATEQSALCAGLEQRLAQRTADARGTDVERAKARLLEAERSVLAARTAERTVTERQDALRRFDEATVALDQHLAKAQADLARDTSLLAERRTAVATDERRVADALDGCASVAERVSTLRAYAGAATAWLDALRGLRSARATLTDRRTERDGALVRTGLADAATARSAALTPDGLARLEQQVTAHERAWDRVTHGLAAPEIASLPEDVVVDVAAAVEAHRVADEHATQASRDAATAHDRAAAATRAAEQLRSALTASAAAREAAAPVIRMANVAAASGSDNAKQLTLATYVLSRRFEDVVAAANARLRVMSSGRYELVRSEEKEAVRARRTGLAMKVVDHHTGADRDPRTLSGGETFYVSLCLALGLADVVTAEAGGTDLGTLFVDEGFGTLDAETLDVVLAELGRLRDGGRVVGVVSHVDALKQAIAERVEVRRLPEGGSTITVRA